MNTLGAIVARNGSTRVPGKALLELEGEPVLWHVIRIARRIEGLTSVCLATTTLPQDDSLAKIAAKAGIEVHRGDPEMVLDRVYGAAQAVAADTLVYIGGDCPLLDPTVISKALEEFGRLSYDYLSNYDPPTFPGGLDVNIVKFAALQVAFTKAVAPSQRIHPFSYLTFHPEEFCVGNFEQDCDLSMYHWSLDYPEDIAFIRAVYKQLYDLDGIIHMEDVLSLIESNNEIRDHHAQLIKPKTRHAFFSSPGMMRDINKDLRILNERAEERLAEEDFDGSEALYAELAAIARKLGNSY